MIMVDVHLDPSIFILGFGVLPPGQSLVYCLLGKASRGRVGGREGRGREEEGKGEWRAEERGKKMYGGRG